MRWDAQRLDLEDPSTLPGMPSIRGLLRSVQVPVPPSRKIGRSTVDPLAMTPEMAPVPLPVPPPLPLPVPPPPPPPQPQPQRGERG